MQQALEDEVTEFPGRRRYERAEETVSHRTGYEPRKVRTTSGTVELERPRVRDASRLGFESRVLGKSVTRTYALESPVAPASRRQGAGAGGGSSFGPSGATFRSARPLYAQSELAASVTISYAPPPAARPPLVTITRPRAGQVIHRFVGAGNDRERRQLVIAGRANDPTGVQGVALSIERLPRRTASAGAGRCSWLHRTRGLVRARCDRPPPLTAKPRAGGSWTYRVPRRIKLPAGRYRVSAFGKNNAGTFGNAAPRRSRVIAFRLSQG